MIEIVVPSLDDTRRIQEREGRYYWSRCAEVLFRKAGIISVYRSTEISLAQSLKVLCRNAQPGWPDMGDFPKVIEGPLSEQTLGRLGIAARSYETDTLMLAGSPSLAVHLPGIRVRHDDKSMSLLTLDEAERKWRNHPFEVQFLHGEGWESLLDGQCIEAGSEGAVALRRGATIVFGFSVFDVLTRWLAVPPLSERYAGFSRMMPHEQVLERLVSLILEHADRTGVPKPLHVSRWPEDYTAALSVRHDYDRTAPIGQIKSLLDCYEGLGVRASIGFLPYLLEQEVICAFRARGHEIQAHVASPTRVELRDDLSLLRHVANYPVKGITIHGGPRGIGFRGATHFDWFDDAGLEYCETFGLRDTVPTPVLRVFDDIPDCSFMMAAPGHMSMDGSTRPSDHRLEALQHSVPKCLGRGDYVIIMNHPDVHHEQVCALLSDLNLRQVWLTTTREAVGWHRVTRYTSRVQQSSVGYEVVFGEALPFRASLRSGSVETPVPAGTCAAVIPFGT